MPEIIDPDIAEGIRRNGTFAVEFEPTHMATVRIAALKHAYIAAALHEDVTKVGTSSGAPVATRLRYARMVDPIRTRPRAALRGFCGHRRARR